jgi:hypothetical protein
MKLKTFLDNILGDGVICLFVARRSDGRKGQLFYTSTSDAADAATRQDALGYDVYHAVATFKDDSSRRVDNVKEIKSLFLDLDCGAGKPFKDQREAIQALKEFCKRNTLPKPFLVNSGGGVHVYWFLSEAASYEEWYPVAERLKHLCLRDGLSIDPAVTSDAARVLRPPETRNFKFNPPLPVKSFVEAAEIDRVNLDVFDALLGDVPVPKRIPVLQQGAAPPMSPMMQTLMGNKESVFKRILMKTQQGVGCAQLAHIVKNQGTMAEPLWRAGLSIAKFCTDSAKAIHAISNKYPGYSAEETEYKTSLIKGPYTCTKFDEFNPDVCIHCPNWNKIKSPIVLGQQLKEAEVADDGTYKIEPPKQVEDDNDDEDEDEDVTAAMPPAIPKYPFPYLRGVNGGVYLRTKNKEGEQEDICLYHNDLYVVKRIRDPEVGDSVVMRVHLPMDGVREFTMPMTAVTSRDEFRKTLAMQGVAVSKMDDLMVYTMKWVNELQAVSKADNAHTQFGWTDQKCREFVLGDKRIFADRTEFNPPTQHTMGLFPALTPKGSLEEWKTAMEFWSDPKFVLQQYAVGIGFGSALMEMANVNCAAIHFFNKESGVGKTAILNAILSVWGHPESLRLQERDTYNHKMHRGEIYHNLPWCIDEITNTPPHEASNMLYQFTGGQQRGRMSASANHERHRGRPWRLLAATTGNTSIIERVQLAKEMPKAEAQRILECSVPRIFNESDDKSLTDAFDYRINNNYGHAGPLFVQYVMSNVDMVRKLCSDVQKKVDAAAGLKSENRFWSAQVTYTIAGLIIAKRVGLVNYDMNAVFRWAIEVLLFRNKGSIADLDGSVQDIMNDFFAEHINNILQIKSTMHASKNGNGLDDLVLPDEAARGRLVARYETDTKLFYVKTKALREWCGELQHNYSHLVEQIVKHCEGKKLKSRLTKGTRLQLPPADVICMRFAEMDSSDGQS